MSHRPGPGLACLLLAAGGSERLGVAKQLLEYRGESLVLRAARLLLTQSPQVVVVTGASAPEIGLQLGNLPVRIRRNEDWPSGMGGSIASGMQVIDEHSDGVLIMLCDQYRIGQGDLQNLVVAWKKAPKQSAVARWEDSFGSPAIFPRSLFGDLLQSSGKRGAKTIIANQSDVQFIDMPNARFDLDTEQDLRAMQTCIPEQEGT